MTVLRFLPIETEIVLRVRETLRDDHGNALHVRVSGDVNPCRSCLRLAPAGTPLILFAHQPWAHGGPYAEIGPVFVHADPCEPYTADRFPEDFRPRTVVFRAYDRHGEIHDATVAPGSDAESVLTRFFASDAVVRIDIRNPAWGCYDFSVVRA